LPSARFAAADIYPEVLQPLDGPAAIPNLELLAGGQLENGKSFSITFIESANGTSVLKISIEEQSLKSDRSLSRLQRNDPDSFRNSAEGCSEIFESVRDQKAKGEVFVESQSADPPGVQKERAGASLKFA
jgi:hypothetical protein